MSLINVLRQSQNEIRALRHRNEILSAKSEVLDIFKAALSSVPRGGTSMTPDVVYSIEAEIDRLEGPAPDFGGPSSLDEGGGWTARDAAAVKASCEAAPVVRKRGKSRVKSL